MDRRRFLVAGAGAAMGVPGVLGRPGALEAASVVAGADPGAASGSGLPGRGPVTPQSVADVRRLFPRLDSEVFLNAAGGTPLGAFAHDGLRRYEELWALGPGEGRGAYLGEMLEDVRARLARLMGATPQEIALVQCTKAGEQVVLDSLVGLAEGGNIVTNDLHFGGSLHNLLGLQRAGTDVRIVHSHDFDVDLERMADAIDDATALVSVTLVSNVNGRREPMRELADLAHARGAFVYADVIQAAGIVPFDVRTLGIDFAAGNGYKWLFGPHGTGFLYVGREHQGTALSDRLFPGRARANYPPWVASPDDDAGPFTYQARDTARRYEPGHHAYLCYAALNEGLAFVEATGVAAMGEYASSLAARLRDQLDPDRYPCITPTRDPSPIVTFTTSLERDRLNRALGAERLVVSGGPGQIRVSPAIYNTPDEVDLLAETLNAI